jgi:adenylate cyclase
MFGGPEPCARPCDDAFAAACELGEAIERFNRQPSELALAPIAVAVGMAYGEVVFGDLGSADRKDYTALGDAGSEAARLQDLAKHLGTRVLMTREFARQFPQGLGGIRDLGLHQIGGHSPVALCAMLGAEVGVKSAGK